MIHRYFVAPKKEVTLLEDVLIEPRHGIIVTSSGTPAHEHLDEILFWLDGPPARSIRQGSSHSREFALRTARIEEIAAQAHSLRSQAVTLPDDVDHIYMLHPFGFHAFGHLFDSLQRLVPIMRSPPARPFVLHSRSSNIIDFEDHVSRFGIGREHLMRVRSSVVVPKLLISPWAAPPAQITWENYEFIFDRYTRDIPQGFGRRLYLSRNHVRPGQRSVLNEAELLKELEALGFEVLYGNEPLARIVEAFHQAEFVTGPHGSQFANTMFCGPATRILEFCPKTRPDTSFRRKRKHATRYVHKLVPGDENHNIDIALEDILAELED